ncbi:thioredoxin domain-containing protein [Nocardioides jiangxiensis]|uniref:Thioredoxin domain-containing protein n=1 Tax=Nocardioides jiangxiensis TaxID=3064524 RepID=A0ABT9B392_9ACTN|nr:thioredoxin domain-containing protein [Nocardioides sp. WY-20]MDO7868845.1 thioredoxin domain-containing protein [Nocardioides sp. WY-20]
MSNRLAAATSPYLLQHADNPVEWWEWGPEAFDEARRRGVPVLLSVGYAACHWCHVMAHESFEDEATAALMNDFFVNVKVDREERPDVDAVYMAATQAMTGSGGWPMTCVLDHEGRPFFAGTYFPDQPRHGQPAFRQVLTSLAEAWFKKPDDVASAAAAVAEHLRQGALTASATLGAADLDQAVRGLAAEFDPLAGGFGGAPKFPPSMVLEFLRRYVDARDSGTAAGDDELVRQARHMLVRTLHAMAGSGMYDQIGGGFARYAVDRGWVVPHFEKMLYDNAQLLGLYARRDNDLSRRVAQETADFLLRELRTPEGGFASALDADSLTPEGHSEEGAFYAWTPAQLVEALGHDRGAWAAELFHVTEEGTFEKGMSTLTLRHVPTASGEQARLSEVKARLLDARELRARPHRDDKVVAAWNGLAISGLCAAGTFLGRDDYVDAAAAAARLLLDVHLVDGRLRRVSRDGAVGSHAGVLEDYACVALGFLDLLQATGDPAWLGHARGLLDVALGQFRADDGGFFDTAADAEELVTRPREFSDNASPCGQSAVVHALATYAALTGSGAHRTAAEETLAVLGPLATRAPRFAGWSLAAAETMLSGPEEVVVVGEPGPERDALALAARRRPGAIVLVASPAETGDDAALDLLRHRPMVDGRPTAYVCRGMVCERPVTDPASL